jgi:anti-sigma regulatory factor (Ser/Thr protein kinase)
MFVITHRSIVFSAAALLSVFTSAAAAQEPQSTADPSRRQAAIQSDVTPDEVVIVVRDPGSGFDPGAIADPLDTANILKPSGRGIFLINELMDHVQFADGGREVRMRKKKTNAPDLVRASR